MHRRSNRSRNKSGNNLGDTSNDRARNGRNDFKQKSNRHCEYCDQVGHTCKYCSEMQANAKKARTLKEIDDRDDDPLDTFNSMVNEDPICDDDLDGCIRNSLNDRIKLNQDSLCITGNQTNYPHLNGNEYDDLYPSFKCSYNYHMDDCNGIMTLDWQMCHTCQFSMALMKLT